MNVHTATTAAIAATIAAVLTHTTPAQAGDTDWGAYLTDLAWERGEDCRSIPIDGDPDSTTWVGPGDYFVVDRAVGEPPPIGAGTTQWGIMDCRPLVAPPDLYLVSPYALVSVDPHADTVMTEEAFYELHDTPPVQLGYLVRADVERGER